MGSCNATSIAIASAAVTTKVMEPAATVTPAVSVYPNPSTGPITVELTHFKAAKATVIIRNLNGQTIAQKEAQLTGASQTVTFRISDPVHSVYLLKVLSTDGVKTEIVVIGK